VRYMVMHYQTQDMEDGIMPSPETQAAIEEYMQEAAMSGVLLSGEGVFPSSAGARVEVTDGKVRVIDGPFAEAKELIGGFAILEVDSLAEAVEHAPSSPSSSARSASTYAASSRPKTFSRTRAGERDRHCRHERSEHRHHRCNPVARRISPGASPACQARR
jgi:hypothetical protein